MWPIIIKYNKISSLNPKRYMSFSMFADRNLFYTMLQKWHDICNHQNIIRGGIRILKDLTWWNCFLECGVSWGCLFLPKLFIIPNFLFVYPSLIAFSPICILLYLFIRILKMVYILFYLHINLCQVLPMMYLVIRGGIIP